MEKDTTRQPTEPENHGHAHDHDHSGHHHHDVSDTSDRRLARRISRMERTPNHSFGFKRAETLASLVNTVALIGIGAFLLVESVKKFLHPEPVFGGVMLTVAVIGLIGNLVTAWLLRGDSKKSLNIKAAYLHIVMDTLSADLLIRRSLFPVDRTLQLRSPLSDI